jgi:hypothetical protein
LSHRAARERRPAGAGCGVIRPRSPRGNGRPAKPGGSESRRGRRREAVCGGAHRGHTALRTGMGGQMAAGQTDDILPVLDAVFRVPPH